MLPNLKPTVCNICGSSVIYTSNKRIYGREYGSGRCYLCENPRCRAFVGTHAPKPEIALGILATAEMREMKKKVHALFDERWLHEKECDRRSARSRAYKWLAKKMNIPVEECHFGYFDMEKLAIAYEILNKQ